MDQRKRNNFDKSTFCTFSTFCFLLNGYLKILDQQMLEQTTLIITCILTIMVILTFYLSKNLKPKNLLDSVLPFIISIYQAYFCIIVKHSVNKNKYVEYFVTDIIVLILLPFSEMIMLDNCHIIYVLFFLIVNQITIIMFFIIEGHNLVNILFLVIYSFFLVIFYVTRNLISKNVQVNLNNFHFPRLNF